MRGNIRHAGVAGKRFGPGGETATAARKAVGSLAGAGAVPGEVWADPRARTAAQVAGTVQPGEHAGLAFGRP